MMILLRSSLVLLALLATVSTANAQTWTIEPVLKRLDTSDNELPPGQADVMNTDTLRIGVYFKLTKSASSSDTVGFESISSTRLYFTSGALSNTEVSAVVGSLPASGTLAAGASPAAETAAGFYRRWERSQVFTAGINPNRYSRDDTRRAWAIGFSETGASADKGIYCGSATDLTCEVFFGVLVVPLSGLGGTVSGSLSMKVAGSTSLSADITANPTNNLGTVSYGDGSNTIDYFVCESTGCPVTATFASNTYNVEEGSNVDVTVSLSEAYTSAITIPIVARTTGTGAGTAPATAYTLPSPSSESELA